jgi:hypothetical protein
MAWVFYKKLLCKGNQSILGDFYGELFVWVLGKLRQGDEEYHILVL